MQGLWILNNSVDFIYLGNATVDVASGYLLLPKQSIFFPVEEELDVYAISAGASSDTRILEGS